MAAFGAASILVSGFVIGWAPVPWLRLAGTTALFIAAHLARLSVRVRSIRYYDDWTEAALIFGLVLLPPGPWLPISISIGAAAVAPLLKRNWIKTAYNAAMEATAATLAMSVTLPFQSAGTTFTPASAIALVCAAAVFVAATNLGTAWVVAATSDDGFTSLLARMGRQRTGAQVSRIAVALLILWCASTPRALLVLPPLFYLLHRQHTAQQALDVAKNAWQQLGTRARGAVSLDEPQLVAQALRDAVTLWRPDAAEVDLRSPEGTATPMWTLAAGGEVTLHPSAADRGHRETDSVIERPLIGQPDKDGEAGELGTLRLIFRRQVSLTDEESLALDVFASSMASAITNARLHEAQRADARAKAALAERAEKAAQRAQQLAEAMRAQALENQRLADQHEHAATHDDLTGLANRRLLLTRLQATVGELREDGPLAALLVVNLREFKRVNAVLGHAAGDQVLVDVARRLSGVVRNTDLVARLSADEFAVLLTEFNRPEGAAAAAASVVKTLRQAFEIGGLQIAFDVAAGFALAPQDGKSPGEILRCAQVALQGSRQSQLDAVERYQPENDPTGVEQLTLLKDLDIALRTGQLVVHYQPKYDLTSGQAIGAEALVRWQHPTRGLLGPGEFMPAAERTGLIGLITSYVLDVVLAEVASWQREGLDLPVAVNISARDLHDPALPDTVDMLLHLHNVAAHRLTLELTETAILSRLDAAMVVLNQLRDLGVKISCDDFGTGNNSLVRLRELPLAELKIDRSFVSGLVSDHGKQAIVKAIVDLAAAFHLQVVAEGIERVEERTALVALGCNAGQGYYLSRPVPAPLIADVLKRSFTRSV